MVVNSHNFCLSGKLLVSPSNLNESLVGQSILGFSFFPFITLSILCLSLLACRRNYPFLKISDGPVSVLGVTVLRLFSLYR